MKRRGELTGVKIIIDRGDKEKNRSFSGDSYAIGHLFASALRDLGMDYRAIAYAMVSLENHEKPESPVIAPEHAALYKAASVVMARTPREWFNPLYNTTPPADMKQ